jgi:hypothetical protein
VNSHGKFFDIYFAGRSSKGQILALEMNSMKHVFHGERKLTDVIGIPHLDAVIYISRDGDVHVAGKGSKIVDKIIDLGYYKSDDRSAFDTPPLRDMGYFL